MPSCYSSTNGPAAAANNGDSAAAAAAIKPKSKPKRPLSGYNLFYRYKRMKVLEATAANKDKANANRSRNDGGDHNYGNTNINSSSTSLSPSDDKAIIHAVLTSTPGLENTSPTSPTWTYPPATIEKLRCANIRKTMEGKLFPNEHARSRLHRKVHGMGFVEMGKTMRDMWAQIDSVTKDVFCELAEVGRIRYRTLLAEYQAAQLGEGGAGVQSSTNASQAAKRVAKNGKKTCLPSKEPGATAAGSVCTTATVTAPAASSSVAPAEIEATHNAIAEPNLLGFIPHVPSQGFRASTAVNSTAGNSGSRVRRGSLITKNPIPNPNYHYRNSMDTQLVATKSPAINTMVNALTAVMRENANKPMHRRVSNSMETQLVATKSPAMNITVDALDAAMGENANTNRPVYRRVSDDGSFGSLHGSCGTSRSDSAATMDNMFANVPQDEELAKEFHKFQQFLSKNAMQSSMLRGDIIDSNATMSSGNLSSFGLGSLVPPPPLFQQERLLPHGQQGQQAFCQSGTRRAPVPAMPFDRSDTQFRQATTSSVPFPPPNHSTVRRTSTSDMNNMMSNEQDSIHHQKEKVSAQDFMEFIGQIDKAIDHNCQHIETIIAKYKVVEKKTVCSFNPSFIFGKPMHDVQFQNPPPMPLPTVYELKNSRARMA